MNKLPTHVQIPQLDHAVKVEDDWEVEMWEEILEKERRRQIDLLMDLLRPHLLKKDD